MAERAEITKPLFSTPEPLERTRPGLQITNLDTITTQEEIESHHSIQINVPSQTPNHGNLQAFSHLKYLVSFLLFSKQNLLQKH